MQLFHALFQDSDGIKFVIELEADCLAAAILSTHKICKERKYKILHVKRK